MRTTLLALASVVATLALSPGASPRSASRGAIASRSSTLGLPALRFGRSVGSPTDGRLIGGAHLEPGPHLRIVPAYEGGDVRWGLEPLVSMIDRAARGLRRHFPEATVAVGHLSRAGGGDIDRHRSHESGRDADIGFFARDGSGRQLFPSHFVPFHGDGTAVGWPGASFDDAKNWALVAALVSDPEARVTHVFVATPLRARLLAYAERIGAPATLRVRAAEVMQQPRGALPHDDHFHVRIGCPPHMDGCVENPTVHPIRPPIALGPHGRRPPNTAGAWPDSTRPDRDLGAIAAPKRVPGTSPASTPNGSPGLDVPREREREREDELVPKEFEPPPASMPAPIDDVDG